MDERSLIIIIKIIIILIKFKKKQLKTQNPPYKDSYAYVPFGVG